MTYLSRIRINPLRKDSRKLLSNPRAVHGAVMGGLPNHKPDDRVLWRMDPENPHRPHLFVLSPTRPDWTHIIQDCGWPDADGDHAVVRDYTPLLSQLAVGREFAFRLTASPVQNTATPTKATPSQAARLTAHAEDGKRIRGFRMGHRTAAAQLDWFLTRTDRWGFDIPATRSDPTAPGIHTPAPPTASHPTSPPGPDPNPPYEVRITARHRHSFQKNGHGAHVVFRSATFEGRLRITDTDRFTTSLLTGLGPSRAYGCGLLTLAPLPEQQT